MVEEHAGERPAEEIEESTELADAVEQEQGAPDAASEELASDVSQDQNPILDVQWWNEWRSI